MIVGEVYIDKDYGLIKIRKVYRNGAVGIADELHEDLTHKLSGHSKLNCPENWVTRAITKERGRDLVKYEFLRSDDIKTEQMRLL